MSNSNPNKNSSNAKVLNSLWLYEEEALSLLQIALKQAIQSQKIDEAIQNQNYPKIAKFNDFDDDGDDDDGADTGDSSEASSDLEGLQIPL